MAIEAGKLRFRCELMKKERSGRNEFGEKHLVGTHVRFFQADILSSKQVERRIAKGLAEPESIIFHCRYMETDISPDNFIRYRGKDYEIQSVENPGQRNIELYIITEHRL